MTWLREVTTLYSDQADSDKVLDDISCLLGCTRNSLHVVAGALYKPNAVDP
jgi:DNA topoisomerase VI subunit A